MPKDALHFFKRAMMPDKGDDEGLIVLVELAERGDFEVTVQSEFASGAGQTGNAQRGFAVGAEGFGDVHRAYPGT